MIEPPDEDSFHAKWIIKFFLAHDFICLAPRENEASHQKSYLKFTNPFSLKNKTRKTVRIIKICIKIYFFHHLFVNLFSLIVHYSRDKLLADWRPEAWFNDDKCNIFANLTFANEEDRSKYLYIDYLNDLLISPGSSFAPLSKTIPIYAYATHLIVIFVYFYYGMYVCSTRQIRIDLLSFLIDPLAERSRIQAQIHLIFDDLLQSINNAEKNYFLRRQPSEKLERMYLRLYCKMYASDKINHNSRVKDEELAAYASKRMGKQMRIMIDTDMLIKLRSNAELFLPANLTDFWLKKMRRNVCLVLVGGSLSNIILAHIGVMGIVFSELSARIKQRLVQIDCTKSSQHQLSAYVASFLPKLSSEQYKIYESYSGSIGSYLEVVWIELKTYLDFGNIVALVRHNFSAYYQPLLISLYASLHVFCHLDRIVWLNQIQAQIEDCTIEMKKIKESIFYRNRGFYDTKRNRKLFDNIAVAYVNLELFRRNQREFKKLSSLFIFQGATFGGLTFAWVYLVGTKFGLESRLISFGMASYVIYIANFYIVFGALLTDKLERIRTNILRLLASCQENLLQYNYLIELWSRRLTSPAETRDLFAADFLGIYLSWDRIITINVYMAGLYLATIK